MIVQKAETKQMLTYETGASSPFISMTLVTWGLCHGQDLQRITSKVASVAPSAPAPRRTHVLPLEFGTVSKVPAQARPLAAPFSGSVTHLSSQGGAQGDEFGDGQR